MRHSADRDKMEVEMIKVWSLLSGRETKQPVINSVQQLLTECLRAEHDIYHSKEKEEEDRVPDMKELSHKWMK